MIEVNNTSIKIYNYNLGDCPKLERGLSYYDTVTHSITSKYFLYDDENKVLTIPGGFNVSYLMNLFPNYEVKYNTKRVTTMHCSFTMNTEPRDNLQRDCINFMVENDGNTQKMICLDTGKGKSYSVVNAISKLKKKALIMVDQNHIMEQWKNENFLKFTNLDEKDIYIISGSKSIDKLLEYKNDLPFKIYIGLYRTVYNYGTKNGWDKIEELFKKIKVGIKVFDEAHVEIKNIFMIDMSSNVPINFYLTASPGRSDPIENQIYKRCFKTVPIFGLEEQKQTGRYIDVFMVTYNSNPTAAEELFCKTNYGFSINNYYKNIFENRERIENFLDIILNIVKLTYKRKGKTALLLHNIEHIKIVSSFLKQKFPDLDIGLFYSGVKKDEKKLALDKKLIISTEKSLGKAVDIADLQFLISTIPTSSDILLHQIIGRLRYNPNFKTISYFDLTDIGYTACCLQQKLRLKFLRKKAKSIRHLSL